MLLWFVRSSAAKISRRVSRSTASADGVATDATWRSELATASLSVDSAAASEGTAPIVVCWTGCSSAAPRDILGASERSTEAAQACWRRRGWTAAGQSTMQQQEPRPTLILRARRYLSQLSRVADPAPRHFRRCCNDPAHDSRRFVSMRQSIQLTAADIERSGPDATSARVVEREELRTLRSEL